MRNSFSKKQIGLAVACALTLGFMSGAVRAQSAVHVASTGQCLHFSYDDPAKLAALGCNPATSAPLAAYTAPAPLAVAAAPMAAVAPTPRGSQKLTFDADMLFDFDKSELRPAGRATLDNFVEKIRGINPEAIMTVGHTDRIGTSDYNQRLSEQRAESVKVYLVSVGIAPDRVHTSGKGETQPVTAQGQCLNGSAKLIACLQPDRRVDIELIGARISQ